MAETKIEWAERVWNPVTGCSKVSEGCRNCYAEPMAKRLQAMGQPRYKDGFAVRCHEDALETPLKRRKPTVWFVNSMSDLFHDDVPEDFIEQVFATMARASQHRFIVLTKRPARMQALLGAARFRERVIEEWDFSTEPADNDAARLAGWPLPNVVLGVSVEDQAAADQRIPLLLKTPAACRIVSAEPLLGPVNLENPVRHSCAGEGCVRNGICPPWMIQQLDGVIVGGESGSKARPMHPDWARSLRDQCAAAGVPFFFKQWGEWVGSCQDQAPAFAPKRVHDWGGNAASGWVGKHAAGRLLDGREHNEMPDLLGAVAGRNGRTE